VNAALVTGLNLAGDIAVSGNKLFVSSFAGTIGEYTTSGATVNPALITGGSWTDIAVSGNKLFVSSFGAGTIGEYTTSGATVNPALISGLDGPGAIAVVSASAPEASSTWTLLLLALTATFGLKRLLRRPA
jgi:hypothetical protein